MMQKLDASGLERWRVSPTQTICGCQAGKRSVARLPVVLISIGLLLGACSRVNSTPLGSTRDGRRQYSVTCNTRAMNTGTCHEQAVALCGGSYETQRQTFKTPSERVLLLACNR